MSGRPPLPGGAIGVWGRAWLARIPLEEDGRERCLRLRLVPGEGVFDDGLGAPTRLWLRGPELDPRTLTEVLGLPWAELWVGEADERVRVMWTASGATTRRAFFHERVPRSGWSSLRTLLAVPKVEVRSSATDGPRVALRFERSRAAFPAGVARLDARALFEWGLEAPRARMRGLRFAASPRGETIVTGDALPPLSGPRYSLRHGVALPLGEKFAPIDAPSLIAEQLKLTSDEVAIFDTPEAYLRLGAESWVGLSRAALRATWPDWSATVEGAGR